MRRTLPVTLMLLLLLAAGVAMPSATACTVSEGSWRTTEYSVTVTEGDRQPKVGAYVSQQHHSWNGQPCSALALALWAASTRIDPILVLP